MIFKFIQDILRKSINQSECSTLILWNQPKIWNSTKTENETQQGGTGTSQITIVNTFNG